MYPLTDICGRTRLRRTGGSASQSWSLHRVWFILKSAWCNFYLNTQKPFRSFSVFGRALSSVWPLVY